jgi:SAM-dependent methyltransferase
MAVSRCGDRRCGHLYASLPAPSQGVQTGRDHRAEVEAFRARNAQLVGAWLRHGFLRPGCAVLDFGSGSGHVALAVRERVGAVTCVEADEGAQRWLRSQGLDLRAGLAECDRRYDAALLVEVIEHLDDPVGFLAALRGHLAPGGQVFLSTPCGETRLGDRRTNAYDTPEHVQFFTERSLARAALAAGYSTPRLVHLPELYPAAPGLLGALRHGLRHQLAMPLLNALRGYAHLVGYLSVR